MYILEIMKVYCDVKFFTYHWWKQFEILVIYLPLILKICWISLNYGSFVVNVSFGVFDQAGFFLFLHLLKYFPSDIFPNAF